MYVVTQLIYIHVPLLVYMWGAYNFPLEICPSKGLASQTYEYANSMQVNGSI